MPRDIAQRWLDEAGDTFQRNDFESYLDYVRLPLCVRTGGGGEWLIGDQAVLREGYDAWVAMMKDQRVTHMIRRVRKVEMRSEGNLWALYSTDILHEAMPVTDPYMSALCLREIDGQWKCVAVASGLANPSWPFIVPRVDALPEFGSDADLPDPATMCPETARLPEEPSLLRPPPLPRPDV